jgi:hypothetical protein
VQAEVLPKKKKKYIKKSVFLFNAASLIMWPVTEDLGTQPPGAHSLGKSGKDTNKQVSKNLLSLNTGRKKIN